MPRFLTWEAELVTVLTVELENVREGTFLWRKTVSSLGQGESEVHCVQMPIRPVVYTRAQAHEKKNCTPDRNFIVKST